MDSYRPSHKYDEPPPGRIPADRTRRNSNARPRPMSPSGPSAHQRRPSTSQHFYGASPPKGSPPIDIYHKGNPRNQGHRTGSSPKGSPPKGRGFLETSPNISPTGPSNEESPTAAQRGSDSRWKTIRTSNSNNGPRSGANVASDVPTNAPTAPKAMFPPARRNSDIKPEGDPSKRRLDDQVMDDAVGIHDSEQQSPMSPTDFDANKRRRLSARAPSCSVCTRKGCEVCIHADNTGSGGDANFHGQAAGSNPTKLVGQVQYSGSPTENLSEELKHLLASKEGLKEGRGTGTVLSNIPEASSQPLVIRGGFASNQPIEPQRPPEAATRRPLTASGSHSSPAAEGPSRGTAADEDVPMVDGEDQRSPRTVGHNAPPFTSSAHTPPESPVEAGRRTFAPTSPNLETPSRPQPSTVAQPQQAITSVRDIYDTIDRQVFTLRNPENYIGDRVRRTALENKARLEAKLKDKILLKFCSQEKKFMETLPDGRLRKNLLQANLEDCLAYKNWLGDDDE